MSTRATTSLSSRRAKTDLVRLLFGSTFSRKGPEAHRMLDPSMYSYDELKKNYLERLQMIHPDKFKHSRYSTTTTTTTTTPDERHQDADQINQRFVELQQAWTKYEEVYRMIKKVGKGEEANFTRFGVGCSFSDTPEERAQREEIMDQAGRGWFSAGALSETTEVQTQTSNIPPVAPLIDKDWFVDIDKGENQMDDNEGTLNPRIKTNLIPGYRPKPKR